MSDWWGTTVIEDDPNDPDMVIVYLCYGTPNQVALRQERALMFWADAPSGFADYQPEEHA